MLTIAPQKFGDPAAGMTLEFTGSNLVLTKGVQSIRYSFENGGDLSKAEIKLSEDGEWT